MAKSTQDIVLRLARTMPRSSQPGIGLHCFHYTQLSQRPTMIVTKHMDDPPVPLRKDVKIVEVKYKDRSALREKLSRLNILAIGLSKIYGELRVFTSTLHALHKNRVRPEIIHVHSANYLLTGFLLKLIYKAPLFLNFGGTELRRAQSVSYYRWMFKKLDGGFYVSRDMEARLFSMMAPNRCIYTGNGIDHNLFFADPKATKRDEIVCVGNLRWQKDYPVLLKAFSKISARYPSYRVRIFGEGQERSDLEQKISELGLDGHVILEGMQRQEIIRDSLQSAKLYVICSKAEGFPKALIEAMACGAAVVATDVGECSNVLSLISETVPTGDSNALADAIAALLSDNERRNSMAKSCIIRSHDFSWKRVSDIVENTYQKTERQ